MLTPEQKDNYEKSSVSASGLCWECGIRSAHSKNVLCDTCKINRIDVLTKQHQNAIDTLNQQRREIINRHETSSHKVRGERRPFVPCSSGSAC